MTRRVRARRALLTVLWSVVLCSLLLVAVQATGCRSTETHGKTLAAILLGLAALVTAVSALRPVPGVRVARWIDKQFDWPDTMQTVYELQTRQQPPESAFEQAVLRRADRDCASKRARDVVSLRVRPGLLAACIASLGLVLFYDPSREQGRATSERKRALRATSGESSPEPAVFESLAEIERARAEGRLSRTDAIRALLALERELKRAPDSASLSRDGKLRRLAPSAAATESLPTSAEQAGRAQRAAEKQRELEALRREQQAGGAKSPAETASQTEPPRERGAQAGSSRAETGDSQQERQQQQARAAALREQLQREERDGDGDGDGDTALRQREAQGQSSDHESAAERSGVHASPALSGGDEPDSREPNLFHRRSSRNARHEDHAVPSQLNEGPSRSEVILTAAKHGFATAPYQRVYRDYRQHAESWIATDQVPNDRRYYVRRYFDAIVPERDEAGR